MLADIDLASLKKQTMTFQRKLGIGQKDRAAVKVVIGNKTYVVKAGDFPVVDHLMNTDLINRLNLKDVHAPASKALTNDFKLALKTKLIGQQFDPDLPTAEQPSGSDKRVLGEALNGNAIISPMAPGSTINELLSNLSGRKKLLDYLATEDGAYALGGLMTIDLVDGMYGPAVDF